MIPIGISIIIPMYNVEKYIKKSILSVLNCNWNNIQFEIVIIDDESPDNSLKFANELKLKNPSIKIIHQKNKGLGGARNTGINNSKGNYLFFLDSDDYLLKDMLPKLLAIASKEDLDVLEFSAIRVDENYQYFDTIFQIESKGVLTGLDYIAEYPFANSACNKLYRRQFLIDKEILFLENVYIEDAPFNVEVFSKAKYVKAVNIPAVAYLQNKNSITRARRTGIRLNKLIKDSIQVTVIINSIASLVLNSKANFKIRQKVTIFVSGILLMIIRSDLDRNSKINFLNELKKNYLYPEKVRTCIFNRDLFMVIVSNENLLRFLFRFKFP
jgi:glycosyltransferase involved in cell wall biosynthesis